MENTVSYVAMVNIRSTPSKPADDHNIIAQAAAGDSGICTNVVPDADGDSHRWLAVQINNPDGTIRAGWTRDDVTYVTGDFSLFKLGTYSGVQIAQTAFASTADGQPAVPRRYEPASDGKWPSPVDNATWSVGYKAPNPAGHPHQGFNLGVSNEAPPGRVYASANGVVLLANPCAKCPGGNGSIHDMGLALDTPWVLQDPGFNYGFGNVVIIRYAFSDIPAEAQQRLSEWKDGWIFCIYGHLHELHVQTNDSVIAGTDLGVRGKSGNTIGVHLHLQVYGSHSQSPGDPFHYEQPMIDPNELFNLP